MKAGIIYAFNGEMFSSLEAGQLLISTGRKSITGTRFEFESPWTLTVFIHGKAFNYQCDKLWLAKDQITKIGKL